MAASQCRQRWSFSGPPARFPRIAPLCAQASHQCELQKPGTLEKRRQNDRNGLAPQNPLRKQEPGGVLTLCYLGHTSLNVLGFAEVFVQGVPRVYLRKKD